MPITINPTFTQVQQNLRDIFGYVLGDDPEACQAIYGSNSAYGVVCPVLSNTQLADPTRLLTKFILTGKANIPATATRLYSTLTFIYGHIVGRVQEEYNDNPDSSDTGVFSRKVISHRKEKYSIQFYHTGAHDAALVLNAFLNDPLSSAEIFNLFGMTLTDISDVRNVNEIISAEWEQRAEMDFCINFSSTMEYDQLPFFEGLECDENGDPTNFVQSVVIKYVDEIYTYNINSFAGIFDLLNTDGHAGFPVISASYPERIISYDEFIYTKMTRLPHQAIIDFIALPDEGSDDNTLFFQTLEGDGTLDNPYNVLENTYLHRFSPVSLFTFPADQLPATYCNEDSYTNRKNHFYNKFHIVL